MGQRMYKRGKVWWVFLGRHPITGIKVYKSTGCRDQRAGEARAAELERELRDPDYRPADQTTVSDALKHILTDRKMAGRADGTLHMYRIKIAHVARVLGADTLLSELEGPEGAKAVDKFTEVRLGEGAARSTIGKELTALRMALRLALRRGEYRTDLAKVMPTQWGIAYEPRKRWLTVDEWTKVYADLTADPKTILGRRNPMDHRAAHLAFIIATSANWGESTRAQRGDIDLVKGEVKIRGTKNKYRERSVPIVGVAWTLLREVAAWSEATDPEHTQRLLFAPWGSVRGDLLRLCERISIPPFSPNDVRRTTAKWLRNAGVEPQLIAPVLGHRDSRMVERVYGRIDTQALGDALRARLAAHAETKKPTGESKLGRLRTRAMALRLRRRGAARSL